MSPFPFLRARRAGLHVLAALLMPLSAQAQSEWLRLQTMPQGHVLHAQAVQRPAAAQPLSVNSLLDYSQAQHWGSKGERFQSSTARWELNCANGTYRALTFTAFAERMGQGPVVAQQAQASDWATAPNGSIPFELLRWACR